MGLETRYTPKQTRGVSLKTHREVCARHRCGARRDLDVVGSALAAHHRALAAELERGTRLHHGEEGEGGDDSGAAELHGFGLAVPVLVV